MVGSINLIHTILFYVIIYIYIYSSGGFPTLSARLISMGPEKSRINSHVASIYLCSFEPTTSSANRSLRPRLQ